MENLQLSLVLQTENKGSVVAGGELNVCLDGLVVDLGSLPNGSTATDSESRLATHTHINTYKRVHTLFFNANKIFPHTFFLVFSILLSGIYSLALQLVTYAFQTPPKQEVQGSFGERQRVYFDVAVEFLM